MNKFTFPFPFPLDYVDLKQYPDWLRLSRLRFTVTVAEFGVQQPLVSFLQLTVYYTIFSQYRPIIRLDIMNILYAENLKNSNWRARDFEQTREVARDHVTEFCMHRSLHTARHCRHFTGTKMNCGRSVLSCLFIQPRWISHTRQYRECLI